MEGVTAVNIMATNTKFQRANLKNVGMFHGYIKLSQHCWPNILAMYNRNN